MACVQPIVARILSLTGADQFIRVPATVEEAMTAR
jgi:anti-anti-sigma regulatory factor